MKRFWVIFIAMLMVAGISSTAMAGYDVRTAITSEDITGSENVCEKYGAVTFTFQAGTKLKDGDTFYFDLPRGVELCHKFDFVIKGFSNTGAGSADIRGYFISDSMATGNCAEVRHTESESFGPWVLRDIGATLGNSGIKVNGSPMFFRVIGTAGARRVAFTVYDNEDYDPNILATQTHDIDRAGSKDGNSTLEILGDAELTLTMFDGHHWQNRYAPDKGNVDTAYCIKDTIIKGAKEADGVYGNNGNNDILQMDDNYLWENFICAKIPSLDNFSGGDYINVSFDSGGTSGNDFLTFQGQREIAHIMGAADVSPLDCKNREPGNIVLGVADVQGEETCSAFDNEGDLADSGYCASPVHADNEIILQTSGTFSPDDEYQIQVTILVNDKTGDNGVYFANGPLSTRGYSDLNDQCNLGDDSGIVFHDTTYKYSNGEDVAVANIRATNDDDCPIQNDEKAVSLVTTSNNLVNDATDKYVWINLPPFVHDPGVVNEGDVVKVQYTILKKPCGILFSGTHIIGTFGCGPARTCMYFPYVFKDMLPWQCGIALSYIKDGEVTTEERDNMEVIFTYHASDGKTYTYVKNGFEGPTWAAMFDSFPFPTPPPSGNGWLAVEANFRVDGYQFVTDNTFGGTTQARVLWGCAGVNKYDVWK